MARTPCGLQWATLRKLAPAWVLPVAMPLPGSLRGAFHTSFLIAHLVGIS